MLPTFLITFREIIEASLIVATILGILTKIGQKKEIRTVWLATGAAFALSMMLLATASVFGLKIQSLYTGKVEQSIEGILMMVSAAFITWAVFFLHNYFGKYKTVLLSQLKTSIEKAEQRGLFVLVFTAVFREGFEIILFLSTIYFSSSPRDIFSGFSVGMMSAVLVSFGLFSATIKMPVFHAFRVTSVLLILFAAGLLARGIHEFAEAGAIPQLTQMTFAFIPHTGTFAGEMIKTVFGITKTMDVLQISLYVFYTFIMSWWVFFRNVQSKVTRNDSEEI